MPAKPISKNGDGKLGTTRSGNRYITAAASTDSPNNATDRSSVTATSPIPNITRQFQTDDKSWTDQRCYSDLRLVSELGPDDEVVPSTLSPNIKLIEERQATNTVVVCFAPRHCLRGDRRVKSLLPKHTGNPTCTALGVRMQLANAAASGWTRLVYDMSNFFQGTIKLASKRTLHIRPGPGQLSWYRRRGYHIPPDDGTGYAIQLGTEFQGEQSAGKESWIFLRQVLTKSEEEGGGGFSVCPVEPGIYSRTRDGHSAVLSVSTDDILATVSHPEIEAFIDKLLQRYFTVKKKTGPVQKFLGARIIQTELGISFDQTAGILQMLHDFFPIDEKVKPCVSFWDDDLEDELYNSEKLQGEALATITKLYRGSANHHQGNLLWYMVWSRPDLMYPTNRIGSLVTMPTRALFQQIKKIFRCLAKYPHRPLFWPSNVPLDSTTTLTRTVSVDKTVTAEISNHLALHADGSENKSVYDPRAIGCTVTTLMGIAVGWKVMTLSQQQDSSTFSEMQTYFNATRSGGIARQIQNFIGDKVIGPIPIYEDNQPTINIVESDNPTNKSRHFATYGAVSRDHLVQGMSKPVKNSTHLQYADIGTKDTPRATREHHHNNMIGLLHYPKPGTEHYKLLQLDKLNCSFRDGIDIGDIPQA